ncbi:MAG: hypothetical protein HGA59_01950 [Chlorobiaceae bacterium]|nr:hypothetical protein [Chlorobiaceae bacterium]NTV16504.1 hypothetical protein [Chlorobiaceae bacterium]
MLSREVYLDYFEQILDVRARLTEQAAEIAEQTDSQAVRDALKSIADSGGRQMAMAEELAALLTAA